VSTIYTTTYITYIGHAHVSQPQLSYFYILSSVTGSYQGKNQPDGVLKGDRPYLMESFRDGKSYIWMKVPEPKYSKRMLGMFVKFTDYCMINPDFTTQLGSHLDYFV
jgi:hypothetical protein